MNTPKTPQILREEVTYQGRFLTTKRLELSNGTGYEMVSRVGNRGAVAGIIEHRETGNYIIIDQFRFPVQKRVLELVAGVCDKSKTREETFRDEIREETGYQVVESITPLGEFTSSAGLTSETTHLFYALVSGEKGEQNLGKDEDIVVHEIPQSKIVSFIQEKQNEGMLLAGNVLSAILLSQAQANHILDK